MRKYTMRQSMIMRKTCTTCIKIASTTTAWLLILCIYLIRPMIGPMNICPYTIGCTQYAIQELTHQPLMRALVRITQRIIRCHPYGHRIIIQK